MTNNTLLVLWHFYQASPRKMERVLSGLVKDELSIGLSFRQQVKSSDSVPDALISQANLEIYIETKLGEKLNLDQLERHLKSIDNKPGLNSQKVLLGLTTTPIDENFHEEISTMAEQKNILFVPITFNDIVTSLRNVCESYEIALAEILKDYENFLSGEGLLKVRDIMSAFPCGDSLDENIKYELYFHPAHRNSKAGSNFIGLYKEKCISWLASIKTVVVGWKPPGEAEFVVESTEKGTLSDDQKARIEGAIKECHYYPDLANESHRYYLFGSMCKTKFEKSSKGGMLGLRNFDLENWISYQEKSDYSVEDVAKILCGKTWE